MPIPSTIADLSTTPGSNSPAGSDPPTEGDNYLRAIQAILRQEHDNFAGTASTLGANLVGYSPLNTNVSGLGAFLNYTFGRTAAEVTAGVTPSNPAYLPGQPERYGAVADGVTSDRAAFTTALSCNSWLTLTQGKTYSLGNVTSATALFTVSGANRGIRFNGAKIIVATTGNWNAPIFVLDAIDGFTLDGPNIEDSGYDYTVDFRGVSVVRLAPTTGAIRNVHIKRAKFKSLVAPLDCTSAANIAENIWFDGECYSTYYGITLTSNGHNLTADYRTFDVIRSYFCAGVRGHDITCVSNDHNSRGNADFLLKVYDASFPYRSNRLRLVSINSQSTANPQLVFESQGAGALVIEDVDIQYNDYFSTGITQSIAFRHYDAGGVLQASDPNTKSRLKVSGYARGSVAYTSAPTTDQEQDFTGLLPRALFMARKSASSLNVTGNGTVVDVVFDAEQRDAGANYDATTGIFTAPRPGWYSFAAQVLLADKSAAMIRADVRIVTTSLTFTNTATVSVSSDYPEQALSISVPRVWLEAGETAKVQVMASGGAGNTADIVGDSIAYTYFSGGQA